MDKSFKDELARYQQLRAAHRNLHNILLDWLPKNAIEESGKVLGIYNKGTLVFNSEDETSVLMDYCIYDYRWNGQNVVERHVAQASIGADSDERILLDAMLEARYSVFAVDEVVRGFGVQTYDLLRGDSGFIMDIALSETAVDGLVLAGRVITPGDGEFSMTTGAPLLADAAILKRIAREIPERFGKMMRDIAKMSPEKAAELSASIIRVFLEGNASSRTYYEDITEQEMVRTEPKVGRNAPCPCGSGKKYKKCCGKVAEPMHIPDRRLMERNLRGIQKLVGGHDFESTAKVNAFLRQFNAKGHIPDWTPETPSEQAQELVYKGLEAPGEERADTFGDGSS